MSVAKGDASAEEMREFFAALALEAGKAALKAPSLEAMHDDRTEIYLFLYKFFRKKAIQQGRVNELSISRESADTLLRRILVPALATVALPAAAQFARTEAYPIVPQRSLRDQLAGAGLALSALAEVTQISGRLDELQGGRRAPFGTVNVLHFAAAAVTLMPVLTIGELAAFVAERVPAVAAAACIHLWSLIDADHREELTRCAAAVSLGLPVEGLRISPDAPKPRVVRPAPAQAEGPAPSAQSAPAAAPAPTVPPGPRVVSHDPDDDGADQSAGPSSAAPDNDDVHEEGHSAEATDFWAQLAGP